MKKRTIGKFVDLLRKGQIVSLEDLEGVAPVKALPMVFELKNKKYRLVEVSFIENKVTFSEYAVE